MCKPQGKISQARVGLARTSHWLGWLCGWTKALRAGRKAGSPTNSFLNTPCGTSLRRGICPLGHALGLSPEFAPDVEEVEQVFNAISYCNGGSVVQMIKAVLAMNNFATTWKSLHTGIRRQSICGLLGKKLAGCQSTKAMMARWTKQMRFPQVKVLEEEGKTDSVVSRWSKAGSWPIVPSWTKKVPQKSGRFPYWRVLPMGRSPAWLWCVKSPPVSQYLWKAMDGWSWVSANKSRFACQTLQRRSSGLLCRHSDQSFDRHRSGCFTQRCLRSGQCQASVSYQAYLSFLGNYEDECSLHCVDRTRGCFEWLQYYFQKKCLNGFNRSQRRWFCGWWQRSAERRNLRTAICRRCFAELWLAWCAHLRTTMDL